MHTDETIGRGGGLIRADLLIYDKAEILSRLFSRISILLENCCAFHSLLFPSRVWKFTNFPRIILIKISANILIYFINCLFDRILNRDDYYYAVRFARFFIIKGRIFPGVFSFSFSDF